MREKGINKKKIKKWVYPVPLLAQKEGGQEYRKDANRRTARQR